MGHAPNPPAPAYPGFMVIITAQAGLRSISVSSKTKRFSFAWCKGACGCGMHGGAHAAGRPTRCPTSKHWGCIKAQDKQGGRRHTTLLACLDGQLDGQDLLRDDAEHLRQGKGMGEGSELGSACFGAAQAACALPQGWGGPTSRSIRLNSSKQAHAPLLARPLKNLACRQGMEG